MSMHVCNKADRTCHDQTRRGRGCLVIKLGGSYALDNRGEAATSGVCQQCSVEKTVRKASVGPDADRQIATRKCRSLAPACLDRASNVER
jgi:hypothetical protein